MNKTLRNRALAGSGKLFYTDYNGQLWFTDTYFASKADISDGYKVKKDQIDYRSRTDMRPKLGKAVSDQDASKATWSNFDDDGLELVKVTANGQDNYIKRAYHELLMNVYPTAELWFDSGFKCTPVFYKVDNKAVAVVMPIRYSK